MNRDNAISYLKRKNKIEGNTTFSEKEKAEIEEVMKEGKIYGDPIVKLNY